MILASPIGGHGLASRKGFTAANSLQSSLSVWAAAFRDFFAADRRQPDPRCCDIATEDAALEKALRRASGTWGGYQASRPFIRQPRD